MTSKRPIAIYNRLGADFQVVTQKETINNTRHFGHEALVNVIQITH